MIEIKLTVHATGKGTCSLTGQPDCDGLTVSFDDGTVRAQHLGWKAFKQLLSMKAGQAKPVIPEALPAEAA